MVEIVDCHKGGNYLLYCNRNSIVGLTEALGLRPLLEGRITQSIRILVPVNRL